MSDITTDTTSECAECQSTFDNQNEGMFSEIKGDWFCEQCYASDLDHSSTVWIIHHGEKQKHQVGDAFVINEYGDTPDIKVERKYVSTDGWRGYYETTIDGFAPVIEGWTTGSWGDPIADRKAVFNDWLDELIENTPWLEFPICLVFDPTSNLFSTSVSLQVKPENLETFKNWLGLELDELQKALS